jgi:hypothetical protein
MYSKQKEWVKALSLLLSVLHRRLAAAIIVIIIALLRQFFFELLESTFYSCEFFNDT